MFVVIGRGRRQDRHHFPPVVRLDGGEPLVERRKAALGKPHSLLGARGQFQSPGRHVPVRHADLVGIGRCREPRLAQPQRALGADPLGDVEHLDHVQRLLVGALVNLGALDHADLGAVAPPLDQLALGRAGGLGRFGRAALPVA